MTTLPVRPLGQMGVGIVRLFRGKDAVNDRRQRGFRYCRVHCPEHFSDPVDACSRIAREISCRGSTCPAPLTTPIMAIVPPTRGDLIDRSNVPGSPTGGIHEFPPDPPRTSRRISLTLCRACGCGV